MISRDEAESRLARLFNGGELQHLPKRADDASILLALAAASLTPQIRYSEAELNDNLADWLAGFADPVGLDFVTLRRYLVDHHFLLRDPAGSQYHTNESVTSSVLQPGARAVRPSAVFERIRAEREARKRAHGSHAPAAD